MSVRDTIEAGDQAMADAINSKNGEATAPNYTEDGAVLPPDAPRQDGRAAVQAFWQAAIDMGLADVVIKSHEVEELGDVATAVGTLSGTVPDGEGGHTALAGKFIVLWRKGADGTWRMHRDIWNFDG
jgi:uncharacterized protein (TIGR02246 family)